jgi:hypothetical protein
VESGNWLTPAKLSRRTSSVKLSFRFLYNQRSGYSALGQISAAAFE